MKQQYELKDLAIKQRKAIIKSMQSHIKSVLCAGVILLIIAGIIAVTYTIKTARPSQTMENCIHNTMGSF